MTCRLKCDASLSLFLIIISGLGEREVYRFGGSKWIKINDPVELAANTIVYGDIVDEISILESKQITTTGFQIIDALVLGGKDVRNLPFEER